MNIAQAENFEQSLEGKDFSNLKIAILLPHFNEDFGKELQENCQETLVKNGVQTENIHTIKVAGALELPFASQKIAQLNSYDAIIALGIVIRGETSHYDIVCENCYSGLMKVQLEQNIPITFGILTCENTEQVKERISKNKLNKGKEFAISTLIQTQI